MRNVFLIVVICLSGCALFKRTNKAEFTTEREASKQTYLDRVDVKTANKEIYTFTWWNDSSIYQYQSIRENLKETQIEKLDTKEKMAEEVKSVKKEHVTLSTWGLIGIGCLILGLVLLYRRLF